MHGDRAEANPSASGLKEATLGCTITVPAADTRISKDDLITADLIDADSNPTGRFDDAKLAALCAKYSATIKMNKSSYDPATHKVESLAPAVWNPKMVTSWTPPGLKLPKTQTITWAKITTK